MKRVEALKIVLISECIEEYGVTDITNKGLERRSKKEVEFLKNCLYSLSSNVVHFESPHDFSKVISKYEDYIVFPYWFGMESRSRGSYIQSLCELNSIKYIGPDSYCKMLCSDKFLSKYFVKQFGLKTSNSVLINYESDREIATKIQNLRYPVIVKPNHEGRSIGINNDNVCYSVNQILDKVNELRYIFNQPIIIEEYVFGNEIKVMLFGNKKEVHTIGAWKTILETKDFMKGEVLGVEIKKTSKTTTKRFPIKEYPNVCEKLTKLFTSFDKVDFMRVDFRFNDGEFYLLELSPDCNLAPNSTPHKTFVSEIYRSENIESYSSFLRFLFINTYPYLSWD